MSKALSLYGLKFNPFRPDVPIEALHATPTVDSFMRRVELGVADGGFALVTGEPGSGKSVVLRLLAERLRALPDVTVATVEHPQSRTSDFYRELGDLFRVPLAFHNRWGGFKALRTCWADHIASSIPNSSSASSSLGTSVFPSAFGALSCCLLAHAFAVVSASKRPRATSLSPAWTRCSRPPAIQT